MKTIFNIVLSLIILALLYAMFQNINEPIEFKAQKTKRERAVINRLKDIRACQEMYRDIEGEYTSSFDSLEDVLRYGRFTLVSVIGDPDDPNFDISDIEYDTTYLKAFDSVQSLEINLDSLRLVPYGEGKKFTMVADTITYQKTLTHVLEVGARRKDFMDKWADPRFKKYDDRYDPESLLKFGNLGAPNLSGNWE